MSKEEEAKAKLWDEVGAPLMRAGFQMAIQEMIELVANIEAMDPNAYSLLCDKLVSMATEQKNASKFTPDDQGREAILIIKRYGELFVKAQSMRTHQKNYFKSRNSIDFGLAKEFERQVDSLYKNFK